MNPWVAGIIGCVAGVIFTLFALAMTKSAAIADYEFDCMACKEYRERIARENSKANVEENNQKPKEPSKEV